MTRLPWVFISLVSRARLCPRISLNAAHPRVLLTPLGLAVPFCSHLLIRSALISLNLHRGSENLNHGSQMDGKNIRKNGYTITM